MALERKLGRTASQRKAMLRGLTTQLLWNGRIETTEARAKEVRSIADKMITLAVREYDKTVDVDDIKDLCKERGGHLVNMGDDYEKGVITGLLACKEYEDGVFCIGDKIYVRVVEKEGRYILEEVNEKVKETGYICEFDY